MSANVSVDVQMSMASTIASAQILVDFDVETMFSDERTESLEAATTLTKTAITGYNET